MIKQEIRKIFKFLQTKEQGHDEHNNNGYIILSGNKYFIGSVSYGEWYLEPYYRGRTKRDKHKEHTLWELSQTYEILQLFIDNKLLEIKIK